MNIDGNNINYRRLTRYTDLIEDLHIHVIDFCTSIKELAREICESNDIVLADRVLDVNLFVKVSYQDVLQFIQYVYLNLNDLDCTKIYLANSLFRVYRFYRVVVNMVFTRENVEETMYDFLMECDRVYEFYKTLQKIDLYNNAKLCICN